MVVEPSYVSPARPSQGRAIAFGHFKLFPLQRLLEENGAPVLLGSRAFDLLLILVEQKGAILSKQELLDRVWPDTNVEEGSLRVSIAAVKKALGQERSEPSYIKNVPGKGYCFVAPIADSENTRLNAPARRGNIPNVPMEMRLLASLGNTLFHTQGHILGGRVMAAFQGSFDAAEETGDVPHQLRVATPTIPSSKRRRHDGG
jgi:DNA-binding winged helix-turn-helix (wHTH) protein